MILSVLVWASAVDTNGAATARGPRPARQRRPKIPSFRGVFMVGLLREVEGGAAGRPSIPHATTRCDTARFLSRPSWNPARARPDDAPDSWNCRNVKSADQRK